jgi:hypothetical protein
MKTKLYTLNQRKDSFKVIDVIIMFLIVLIGVIFWNASADSLVSQCGVIG